MSNFPHIQRLSLLVSLCFPRIFNLWPRSSKFSHLWNSKLPTPKNVTLLFEKLPKPPYRIAEIVRIAIICWFLGVGRLKRGLLSISGYPQQPQSASSPLTITAVGAVKTCNPLMVNTASKRSCVQHLCSGIRNNMQRRAGDAEGPATITASLMTFSDGSWL